MQQVSKLLNGRKTYIGGFIIAFGAVLLASGYYQNVAHSVIVFGLSVVAIGFRSALAKLE